MRATDFLNDGTVHHFPKKHKGDLSDTHNCPKCGGDLQGGKYMGHQVKVCMPCKQVYLPPNSGIDQKGNKIVDEIAGAFPSPSTRAKWAADAAASNTAEAKRQADIKAKADAERLRVNNAIVDREQRINYHPMPDNEVPVKEVAMRMQGSSQSEKDANARAKALEAEEKAKHLAIVKAYVDIMAAGKPLPPRMQQSYNTMPDFRKEVDTALKNIPGQPGVVDLEQRRNYHLLPKNEGAKVDRMVKHIAKSERGLGKSKDDAESIAWATANKRGYLDNANRKKQVEEQIAAIEAELEEHGKASRALCISSRPDSDLGASNLASCKSQGLRARDGKKSHKLGKGPESRVKVGGHKIKGHKYGGPLPDWS